MIFSTCLATTLCSYKMFDLGGRKMSEFDKRKEEKETEVQLDGEQTLETNEMNDEELGMASEEKFSDDKREDDEKVEEPEALFYQQDKTNEDDSYSKDKEEEVASDRLIAAAGTEEPSAQRSTVRASNGGNGKVKGFLNLLAAGVVGSALTLFTIPHTDFYQDSYSSLEQKVEDLSSKVENSHSSNITAQQTSTSAATGETTSIADMVEASSKAIVGIVNLQQQSNPFSQSSTDVESGSGSGIIFKKDDQYAYIVTNNHVIEGANTLEVSLYSGDKVEGKLIGADALTDLAVVRIDAEHASDIINFGDSSTLRPGDQVWAIGNPLGLDLSRTVTQGIVSAVDRSITVNTSAGDWEFNVIQTDAAINPGNSGGALINSSGQVIGINSLKISDSGVEGLGFAIPSNDLIPIVNEIIENGKIERPYLGVGLASLDEIPRMYLQDLPNEVSKGVMVTNIDSESAAGKAGLKIQDVLVSINGSKIESATDLRKYLYTEVKIGDTVKLELYRDGKLQTVELTLTSNRTSN